MPDMFGKKICFITVVILCLSLCACKNVDKSIQENENIIGPKALEPLKTESVDAVFEPEIDDTIGINNTTAEDKKDLESIQKVDYSNYFDELEGCAVFLNSQTGEYKIYQEELSKQSNSPCSTFKIISTLMGLEKEIISTVDSKMGYDGTTYPNEAWNVDIGLRDAFNVSCIWYFRKIIDFIGPIDVQTYLNNLEYGNCDTSEWFGSDENTSPALNGFWLESSLQISPKNQVEVLANIFGGTSGFSDENIKLLKEIMLVKSTDNAKIYGKTGTGRNTTTNQRDNGWFVGMLEDKDEVYYFAVHLSDKTREVSGQKAKEIAFKIMNENYITDLQD